MSKLRHGRPEAKALRITRGNNEALLLERVKKAVQRGATQIHPLQQIGSSERAVDPLEGQQNVERPVHRPYAVGSLL